MKSEHLATLFVAIALVFSFGCGNGHGNAAGNSNGNGIGGGGGTVPVTGNAFVYVSDTAANTITAFKVEDASGTLIAVAGSPFASAGTSPGRMAVSTSARLLFVINRGSGTLTSHMIDGTTGVLSGGSTINTGTLPVAVVISPIASLLYVLNSDGTISGFGFDAVGFMTPLPGSPFQLGTSGAGAKEIATDPAGRFLFITVQAGILIFQINPDGLLTLANLPRGAGAQPTGIAVSPGNSFIFSTDVSSGQIFGWKFLPGSGINTGLTQLPGSPVSDGVSPVWISITPAGNFLYVGGGTASSGTVHAFAIGTSGLLTPLVGTFAAPFGVTQIAIDSSGQFLYAASPNNSAIAQNSGALTGYLINQSTGVLTTVPGSPFSVASPGGVVVVRFP